MKKMTKLPIMPKALRLEKVRHRFALKEILNKVSLEVHEGEVVSLVGPSGCGKTTLLNLASGMLQPEEGCVQNTFHRTARMFQEDRLLPWKNTLENIILGLKAQKTRKQEREQLAIDWAFQMGLNSQDLEKFPHQLSGGMRQRAALARALAVNPDLLLLDEPFSALDVRRREELQNLLLNELTERGIGVLFVTHDLSEAVRLSHRILVMGANPGRLIGQYLLDTPWEDRDYRHVWYQTHHLLQMPEVAEAFSPSHQPMPHSLHV